VSTGNADYGSHGDIRLSFQHNQLERQMLHTSRMYRVNHFAALFLSFALGASGATLQRLSMDDMIAKSSAILRGKVGACSASFSGNQGRGMIYTHCAISITEAYKGPFSAGTVDVAVPGGTAQGMRQIFDGAPVLEPGTEYMFFLWTSRSGLTQIIGLSQGLFNLHADAGGNLVLTRNASTEPMLDSVSGKPVQDQAVQLNLSDLKTQVRTVLATAPRAAK
jgi:hypothetical protein